MAEIILLLRLFATFFYIGIFTFGGGYAMIPLIQDEVISQGFVGGSESLLIDMIAIAQSMPGVFAINISTFVGSYEYGVLGGMAAAIGVAIPSFVIILLVAKFFKHFSENKYVKGFLRGITPLVVGVLLTVGVRFLLLGVFETDIFNLDEAIIDIRQFVILGIVIALMLFGKRRKIHPIFLILIAASLGLLLYGVF